LAADATHMYIADYAGCRVRVVLMSTGVISTIAGTGTCGYSGDGVSGSATNVFHPEGLATDGTTLYIADRGNCRVRAVNLSTFVITTLAGTGVCGYSGDFGNAGLAQLSSPTGVALDGTTLYIADAGNCRVRKVNLASVPPIITTAAGKAC
jgi:hypothetical protein